jgi:hypothetical protein
LKNIFRYLGYTEYQIHKMLLVVVVVVVMTYSGSGDGSSGVILTSFSVDHQNIFALLITFYLPNIEKH